MIAEELVKNDRAGRAIPFYEQAIQAAPDEVLYQIRLGVVHFRNRDYAKADAIFRTALARSPDSPVLHYLIGYTARAEGLFEEAAKSLTRSLELEPNNAAALSNLGFIAVERGQQ